MAVTQAAIEAKGEAILDLADAQKKIPDALNPAYYLGRMMEWSMGNEALKVQTLRFVDVLPTLHGGRGVVTHLREYFGGHEAALPKPLRLGLDLTKLAPGVAAAAVKFGAGNMARQFITGRTGAEAVPVLKKLRARGIGFTVDILGEAVVSEREADEYFHRYLELVESLAVESRKWPHDEQLDGATRGATHMLPKVNVSVKISALYSQIHPADPETAIARLQGRLKPLFRRAKELGVFINLDMENYALKRLTLDLFRATLEEPEFQHWHDVGLVIQAYLSDAADDFEELLGWAKAQHRHLTVRLVKGAYWDYETVIARQRGWPVPVYLQKPQADANFERISRRMLANSAHVYSAFGTHNVRSMANAIATAESFGLTPRDYEIQMLYGMAEPIKAALVQMGHRVREYCPVGEMLPGMAYLVRRLLENNSNEGFLKAKFSARVPARELLRDPRKLIRDDAGLDAPRTENAVRSGSPNGTNGAHDLTWAVKPFENDPPVDFTLAENRDAMRAALASERAALGKNWPLVIGGKEIVTESWIDSVNPSRPAEIVGRCARATTEHAQAAVSAAVAAAPGWRATPAEQRAALLEAMAERMRAERFQLAALEIFETGKPWVEADGDIAEAIDFCDFYAHEMRRLARPQRTHPVPGETSDLEYVPRGVGLVIAPWNFPLAILCGMTVAALVTGNTVIMKPAEQSGVVAARFMQIARRAGIPDGVLNLVSGHGEEVGALLVEHPQIDFVAFTGSREVGLKIWEAGGRTRPGQAQLKKIVCEMGGKNALIIDADADLDEAVLGTLYSAFGYQGQKCSALSRLIVLEDNYERTVARMIEATRALRFGSPEEPGVIVGPVIDQEAHARILRYIEIGKIEAKLAFQAELPTALRRSGGYFVPPTIFRDVPPTARIAREEVFGPVLAVLRARDLDHALALANDTEFALTGGVYSRSPANIERVKRELNVGNLYINRGITGAIVARHPFGGYKMSGGGTKAGGRDYLLNFLFPRVVTENVLRRGFAPVEEAGGNHSLNHGSAAGAGQGI
ncbi:MAG: proline dehydrogenase family protein [Verrucomicrobia bacterium]|nr:proline dehydrogenase family protein [Verrucomicrobiota bacterium]